MKVQFFPEKKCLSLEDCLTLSSKEICPAEVPFVLTYLLTPLEMYVATGCLKKNLCCSFEAQIRPFLTALALRSYPTGLRYSSRVRTKNKLALERLSIFHKSASNITHSAITSPKRSACVLHTLQHALTAYSLVSNQCSVLATVVLPSIITVNVFA